MKRNKHSLSHYRLLTCDMGRLVPIGCYEVLPGDSVQQSTSLLVRVSPQLAPVMHPISVRVHHWFVPHRLVWSGWEDFITGGPDGVGGSAGPYPTITIDGTGTGVGTIMDYLGVPQVAADAAVSAFPVRSYNKIFNEFYRDQDLMTEATEDQLGVYPVCWEKDYFTSARPWPQKGLDVSMPLGVEAPVVRKDAGAFPTFDIAGVANFLPLASQVADASAIFGGIPSGANVNAVWGTETGLKADLTNATAVNVNDVRRAFALQRYQEARARYGSRYTEYLAYLGVRSSDARLQRPEYLGGGKATISFSEVLKTGAGEDPAEPIGTLKGHGISAMRSRRFRRFFEEHGLVISLLSVRPRTMYTEATSRMWSRRTKEEYWQRELEQIGQQEVYSREIFGENDASGGAAVFGYQDRYAEYKHLQSSVHGEFRNLLNYWHLGRTFTDAPVLNGAFVACDPGKRIFADQTQHSLWVMANHSIQARRMVSRSASSRIL